MKILVVCLGNICRSPIAEGLLRHKIKQHGLNWIVESAGTESYHVGEPPHRFSQKICKAHGIDISSLRARKFTREDFTDFDVIYAMANDVYYEIHRIGGRYADMSKVDYFLNELYHLQVAKKDLEFGTDSYRDSDLEFITNASVPDPYLGVEEDFKFVYDLIDKTCNAIIENHKRESYV